MHGMRRFGHAGRPVQNGKYPLSAGGRSLHGRHHAAHGIHAGVKAAYGSDKHDQFADIIYISIN